MLTLLFQRSSRTTTQSPEPVVTPKPKKPGRPRKLDMVLIPTPERALPQTPPKTPMTTPYRRRYGPTLYLSDKALAKTRGSYVPPTEEAAHPKLPAVLFRFWSDHTLHCSNSENGFVASKYIETNVVRATPPPISQVDPADIVNHTEGLKVRRDVGLEHNSLLTGH